MTDPLEGAPGGTHDHPIRPSADAAAVWDERYRSSTRIWSGRPNQVLVDVVSSFDAGTALDLGCGEGGDAVWLARRGWQVTAVDISDTALLRTRFHAEEAGVSERVTTARHDFSQSFPAGTFDLVSAQFLHSHVEFPREDVLRRAAAAVAPGGLLLIVGHLGVPSWAEQDAHHANLPTGEQVRDQLQLTPDGWTTELLEDRTRSTTSPDGAPAELTDTVLAVRRTS